MPLLLERKDLEYSILGVAPDDVPAHRVVECGYRAVGQISSIDPGAFRWCGWQPIVDAHCADYSHVAAHLYLEGSLKREAMFRQEEKARLQAGLAELLQGTNIEVKDLENRGWIDNLKNEERISGNLYLVTSYVYGQGIHSHDSIKQFKLYLLAEGDTLYTERVPPEKNLGPFPSPERVNLFWVSDASPTPTLITNGEGPLNWTKVGSLREVSRSTLGTECYVTNISEDLVARLRE